MEECDPLLLQVARSISEALGRDAAVLVGGLAVSMWGYDRNTRDVDFASNLPPKDLVPRLKAAGIEARVSVSEVGDPVPWIVYGTLNGVRFDILPPIQRLSVSEGIDIEELGLRVCRLEDLVRMKFYSGGAKDIQDVAQLSRIVPDILPYALQQARHYDVERMFQTFLLDRPPLSSRFDHGHKTEGGSRPERGEDLKPC